ncbi:MAG: hypothetical protein AVDCRST_MAG49-2119 [uncultured Thermomicrobiales bacterium]|uniref:Uncharacterized protein n=1 Tax=uncultured Thermomicrobiales bacterium TaxID=1645740 RepID=A0A6J4US73_9BACT|nr:MAG: hypothetical protein AVDCRST_MAG49-2119 [uncultured Thermomicrobiales bacterium]
MSERDRSDRFSTAPLGDIDGAADLAAPDPAASSASTGRWDLDPAEVDRYLAERETTGRPPAGTGRRSTESAREALRRPAAGGRRDPSLTPSPRPPSATPPWDDPAVPRRGTPAAPRGGETGASQTQRDGGGASSRSRLTTRQASDHVGADDRNAGVADDWLDTGWDEPTPRSGSTPENSSGRRRAEGRAQRGRPSRTGRAARPAPRSTADRRDGRRRSADPLGGVLAAGSRGVRLLGRGVSGSRQRLAGIPLGGLLADRTVIVLLGGLGAGLVALWSIVGLRIGSLPPAVDLRLGVEGETELWGNPTSLWRLPLLATFLAAMVVVAAAGAARFDRFAPRFVLAAGLLVQILVWIAVFGLAW